MSLETTADRKEYAGDDLTVAFPFPYYFLATGDLVVTSVVTATGAETTQVEGTDYTVTGAGVAAGGAVTFGTAPASTVKIVIERDPAATQLVDQVEGDPLPVDTVLEQPLDRLTMLIQRLRTRLDRAVRLPDGDTGFSAADLQLAAAVTRAGMYLGFDASGDLAYYSPVDLGTIDATAATYTATPAGAVERSVQARLTEWVSVQDFGAAGDGVTDDTAAFIAAEAGGGGIYVPNTGSAYIISTVPGTTSCHWRGIGMPTIKQKSTATDHMFKAVGTSSFEGIAFDGNQAALSDRFNSIVNFDGASLTVEGCTFTGSMFAAVQVDDATTEVRLVNNRVSGMAEHSGVAGQQTQAFHITTTAACKVFVSKNRITHGTPADADAAPGGMIFAGVALSVSATDNYFENIGQRKSINFIGCIDLYTDCDRSIVQGNHVKNYYYNALKLQNADTVICANNIVDGADSASAVQAISLQYARSFGSQLNNWLVHGNILVLSGSNVGLVLQGDATGGSLGTYYSHRIVVANNIIDNPSTGIDCDYIDAVEMIGNIISGANNDGIDIANTDVGTGAPTIAKISIRGGEIRGCGDDGVLALSNVTNLQLNMDGILFDATTGTHVKVNGIDEIAIHGCNFADAAGDGTDLSIVTAALASIVGNRAYATIINTFTAVTTLVEKANSWQPDIASTANLGSLAHTVNVRGKYRGRMIYGTDTNIIYVADGAAAGDVWYTAAGGGPITPS